MAPTVPIRVKLEFREKIKVQILDICARVYNGGNRKWCSGMDKLTKLIFESFPEIEKMVKVSRRMDAAGMLLIVKYINLAGDIVTIENDVDLDAAGDLTPRQHEYYDIQLQIDVIPQGFIVAANSGLGLGRSEVLGSGLSGKTADHNGAKQQGCGTFESGHCGGDPLHALQSVVLKLEESTSKNELMAIFNRLVDHRQKLQQLLFLPLPEKCLPDQQGRQTITGSQGRKIPKNEPGRPEPGDNSRGYQAAQPGTAAKQERPRTQPKEARAEPETGQSRPRAGHLC